MKNVETSERGGALAGMQFFGRTCCGAGGTETVSRRFILEATMVKAGSGIYEEEQPSHEAPEMVCPISGEVVPLDDVDGLISMWERIDQYDKYLYGVKSQVRDILAAKTEGESRTRRVAGKSRVVRLEFPGDSYDNSILKEAWEAYPQFREQYLRIAKIDPKMVEIKKLMGTAGTPELNTFRNIVAKANRGPTGMPSLKVEK